MKKMLNNKYLAGIALVVLLVFNIVLAVLLLWPETKKPGYAEADRAEREQRMERFVINRLELDDDQVLKMRALRKEQWDFQRNFHKELRDKKSVLIEKIFEEDIEKNELKGLMNDIEKLQGQAAVEELYFLLEMKQICRPQQYPELMRMYDRMNRHWHPQRGDRPGYRNKRRHGRPLE